MKLNGTIHSLEVAITVSLPKIYTPIFTPLPRVIMFGEQKADLLCTYCKPFRLIICASKEDTLNTQANLCYHASQTKRGSPECC